MIRKWKCMTVHKSVVRPDDNLLVDGQWITLCPKDFGMDWLLGRTIRGDSYGPTYMVSIRRLVVERPSS